MEIRMTKEGVTFSFTKGKIERRIHLNEIQYIMWHRDGYHLKRFESTFLLPRQPSNYGLAKQEGKSNSNENTKTTNEKGNLCTGMSLIKEKTKSCFVQTSFC